MNAPRLPRRTRRHDRRGFNLIELLVALGISAALLAATMVALNACFLAYQATTQEASTHTISRLVMNRLMTMVRTGADFGPIPDDPRDEVTTSDFLDFTNRVGQSIRVSFDPDAGLLTYSVDGGDPQTLLAGVTRTVSAEGDEIAAFTMEWDEGVRLYRVTMDVTVAADASQALKLDAGLVRPIRLIASSMPRNSTW